MNSTTSTARNDRSTTSGDAHSSAESVPHPPPAWISRIVVPAVLLASLAGLLGWSTRDFWLPATKVRMVSAMILPAAKATTVPAATGQRSDSSTREVVAQASGWIEPDPYPVFVTALAEGILERIHVLEGQTVREGQPVATLVSIDAKLARDALSAELTVREAQVAAAEARLEAAREDWAHPIEQTRAVAVAKAALAGARGELARLPARIRAEQSLLAELIAVYEAVRKTRSAKAATALELMLSKQQADRQKAVFTAVQKLEATLDAKVDRLEAELRAAEQDLKLRTTEKRELAEAKAALKDARARQTVAEAHLAQAELRLQRMEVRSPSEGRVMRLLKAPGDKLTIMADDPRSAQVAGLYRPDSLQIRVDVPLADAAKIRPTQRCEIVADILPDRTFSGRVTRIVREADIQKNTLEVKVAIDSPQDPLTPEVLARVKFLGNGGVDVSADQAPAGGARLFVPRSLVVDTPGGPAVYVAEDSARIARRRIVRLGRARHGAWVQVLDGLRPGDRVISNPQQLTDGERIRVIGAAVEFDRE